MAYFIKILKEDYYRPLPLLIIQKPLITSCNIQNNQKIILSEQKYSIKNTTVSIKLTSIISDRKSQLIHLAMVMQKELNFSGGIRRLLKMSITGSLILTWIPKGIT